MLEEVEFQKQEVVNEGHVTDLIDREGQQKSQKNCQNVKPLETVPNSDHAHEKRIIRTLMINRSIRLSWPRRRVPLSLWISTSLCFLWGRREEFIVLYKCHT